MTEGVPNSGGNRRRRQWINIEHSSAPSPKREAILSINIKGVVFVYVLYCILNQVWSGKDNIIAGIEKASEAIITELEDGIALRGVPVCSEHTLSSHAPLCLEKTENAQIIHVRIPAESKPKPPYLWQEQMAQRQITKELETYGIDPALFLIEYSEGPEGGVWHARVALPAQGEAEVIQRMQTYTEETSGQRYSLHYEKDQSRINDGTGGWKTSIEENMDERIDEHPDRL